MSTTAVKVTAAQLARIPQPLLLKVTLVKSAIRTNPKVRKNLTALGLNKINKTMIHKNVRPIRGMINAVKHYIKVEPLEYIPKVIEK